ncbi:MAG: hypothetical protein DRI75_06625 [Bacteroidetes bacterium]|nr:MAG: hypothetical protein DRI75_06625 [Bacteroidota bacterium]
MCKLKIVNLFLLSSLILFLNFSCKKTSQTSEEILNEISSEKSKVSAKDIDQIKYTEFALSNLSEKSTQDWLKFKELQEEIDILKKGDLSFFEDDKTILQSFFKDLKVEIPESLNIPSILVRLSVLETTVFKLKSTSNINNVNKEILLNAIKEVLVANSNVILQMNKKFEKDSQNIEKPN